MNVSGIRHSQVSIFCSVEEHDTARRSELIEQLGRFNIKPELCADKVVFRYRGSHETVLKLAEYAESHQVHSISISSGV